MCCNIDGCCEVLVRSSEERLCYLGVPHLGYEGCGHERNGVMLSMKLNAKQKTCHCVQALDLNQARVHLCICTCTQQECV